MLRFEAVISVSISVYSVIFFDIPFNDNCRRIKQNSGYELNVFPSNKTKIHAWLLFLNYITKLRDYAYACDVL